MNFKYCFITVFMAVCLICRAVTFDASADYSGLTEEQRIEIYNDNKAEVFQRQFLDHGKDKGVMQAIYEDNVVYDIYRGNGDKVKLSKLIGEMGNSRLAENLKFGECYYGFMGGLISCAATTGVLAILGIAFTVFRNGMEFKKYEYCQQEPLNEYMISAICMFSVGSVTLIGTIIFSIFFYKSSLYKLNVMQSQSLVKQYNKFLQKKLGIVMDLDKSFYKNHVDFSVRLPL